MNYEEHIKNKLWKLWEEETIRRNQGWGKRRVCLGKGIGRIEGLEMVDKMLDTIEDFGINLESLNEMKPNYEQICEIYQAIQSYRGSVKFLRELKDHMGTFKGFKGWRKS